MLHISSWEAMLAGGGDAEDQTGPVRPIVHGVRNRLGGRGRNGRRAISLRLRLGAGLSLLVVIGMIGLYVAAFAFGRSAADRSYDRLLASATRLIADALVETRSGVDVDIPYSAFELLDAASDDRIFYRIYGSDGRTLTGYGDLPGPPGRTRPSPSPYRSDAAFFTVSYRGEPVRFVVIGRTIGGGLGNAPRTMWVEVGQTRRAHAALVRELILRSLAPVGIVTLLAIWLVWFGIGQALRPLERIGEELAARGPADLDPITAPVPAEVDHLVGALDGFMARLAANIVTLKSFVGDAAHQLRTPLAALRAQAQVADRADPEDLRRSLDAVERNAEKLTRLVNQMLSDATMSHRLDVRYSADFDLVETVREAVHDAVAFTDGGVCFDSIPDSAPMRGDPLMLAEAMRNIADNAILHGGGQIAVRLVADRGGFYVIDIADRGPGIPEARRNAVFQRFSRGEGSSRGAGLGLAIAARAIARHGGTITLLDNPGGGLCVRVTLPQEPSCGA